MSKFFIFVIHPNFCSKKLGSAGQYDKIIFITHQQHITKIIKILRSRIEDQLDTTKYILLHSDIPYKMANKCKGGLISPQQNDKINSNELVSLLRDELLFWQENALLKIHVEDDRAYLQQLGLEPSGMIGAAGGGSLSRHIGSQGGKSINCIEDLKKMNFYDLRELDIYDLRELEDELKEEKSYQG